MDMIKCEVSEDKIGPLTITFDSGRSIYLQTDYERAQFGVDCGLIKAPENWDGQPDNLPDRWWVEDFESITECPEHYQNNEE